jgi:hypothetical protein
MPIPLMSHQVCHHRGGHGLPANGATLLADVEEAAVLVEVLRAQGEGSAAAARGFGVQSQYEGVEFGVVAGGGDGVVDLGELRRSARSGWTVAGGVWRLSTLG